MTDYEKRELYTILEADSTLTIKQALEILENGDYSYYDVENMEELAMTLIDYGYFGEISEEIERYVDYEKLAKDLHYDGYIETSTGIIIFY